MFLRPKYYFIMNKFVTQYIKDNYGFNPEDATPEQLGMVTKIVVNDVTGMYNRDCEWDFSMFPNLEVLECANNFISELIINNNRKLKHLNWAATRGGFKIIPDISNNTDLKELIVGQDNMVELDLRCNPNIEILKIYVNSSMRWLDLSNCKHLKSIEMEGVNIPFVDLTLCKDLEYVNINYLNLYRNRCDDFGPGYPRPIVFVNEDFDEKIIKEHTRFLEDYTYFLIRVKPGTKEEKFLNFMRDAKDAMVAIPEDRYGNGVGEIHYKLLRIYREAF